jgi:integrase
MGAKQIAFTQKRVQAFPCPADGYVIHWDAETPGLGLRITASGVRRYIFEKRVHGKTVRVTIGDPSAWKLDDVRKEARRLVTVVDRGIDPRDEAAEQRARAEANRVESSRRDLVVEGVWQAYVDARKPKWGARHLANHIALAHRGGEKWKRGGKGKLTKPGPLASLMGLKLSELTAERIAAWLKRETAKRPTSTGQAYRALRAFIAWTHDYADEKGQKLYKGIVPADACSSRGVRENVPKSKAKTDCLQREQLPGWFDAVRKLSNPIISAYLQTVLITGPRRGEMCELRWSDVDFKWNSLTLHDKNESKGGEDGQRVIPLTPYVASLLKALPRTNEWVFASPESDTGHIVEPRIAHNKALKAAGLPHITLHGLRRSFSTLSEWVEVPTGVVAQIQGHKPSATAEKHYKVRPLDLLRMWHRKVETWILKEGKVKFTEPKATTVKAAA